MLKRPLSLATRGVVIFAVAYLFLFFVVVALISWRAVGPDGDGRQAGPDIAISFALRELSREDGGWRLQKGGRLQSLATRNPGMWLVVADSGEFEQLGPLRAPPDAISFISRGNITSSKFDVTSVSGSNSNASVRRARLDGEQVTVAAGGIDSASLSIADGLSFFLAEAVVPLVALGTIGLLTVLLVLPLVLRAVDRLTRQAAAIDPAQPSMRISEGGTPRELLPLARSFNLALGKLEAELARRRRFIADVAHELRTPLAIIALQVDGLPIGEARTRLQRALLRFSNLVAQMLDVERLALVDEHRMLPVDLVDLSRQTVAEIAPMVMAAGHEISLDVPDAPVILQGDPLALGRALSNLVGNAVAHGRPGGEIAVRVTEAGTIDVFDDGPGVPEGSHGSLFEPFSRERWDRDGCGLGLHLTRQIMRAHGGDALFVPVESGALFRLEFRPDTNGRHRGDKR